MKKNHLNGQVLSEKEMKEVKGGAWYLIYPNGKLPEVPFPCEVCGHPIKELTYNGDNFLGICENCGSRKEIQLEE